MARYRKRPVEVEAFQWFEGRGLPAAFYVVTIHGQRAVVADGDWIITEPDMIHHYPCKPEIFEATYDPVVA
jgi:hypothetical protein